MYMYLTATPKAGIRIFIILCCKTINTVFNLKESCLTCAAIVTPLSRLVFSSQALENRGKHFPLDSCICIYIYAHLRMHNVLLLCGVHPHGSCTTPRFPLHPARPIFICFRTRSCQLFGMIMQYSLNHR